MLKSLRVFRTPRLTHSGSRIALTVLGVPWQPAAAATILVFLVFMIPARVPAQDKNQQSEPKHHHYKLIDLGTFGGPQSFVNFPPVGYAPVLNNSGTVAGWADTAVPDPHPNFCFLDCYVEHAFRSKGTGKINLGSLPAQFPPAACRTGLQSAAMPPVSQRMVNWTH